MFGSKRRGLVLAVILFGALAPCSLSSQRKRTAAESDPRGATAGATVASGDGLAVGFAGDGSVVSLSRSGTSLPITANGSGLFYRDATATAATKVPLTVTSAGGTVSQTATVNNLRFDLTFSPGPRAIKGDLRIADLTGSDRAVEVMYRVPIDATGWTWSDDLNNSRVITATERYEKLWRGTNPPPKSLYPLGTVAGPSAALTVAVPMVAMVQRGSYSVADGLQTAWDVGLSAAATKWKSKAAYTFWLYATEGAWKMRGAAETYYALNPESFATLAKPNDGGSWFVVAPQAVYEAIPNPRDFGPNIWNEATGVHSYRWAAAHGFLSLLYLDPQMWYHGIPGYPVGTTVPPPYDVLVTHLERNAAGDPDGDTTWSTTIQRNAQAAVNSSPKALDGRYQVKAHSDFWYGTRLQAYPQLPDPEIPAPSAISVIQPMIDATIASRSRYGYPIHGFFCDDLTMTYGAVENYRRDLWAHCDVPLAFSRATKKPVQYEGFAMAEWIRWLGDRAHPKGLKTFGSPEPGALSWVVGPIDAFGQESRYGFASPDTAMSSRFYAGTRKLWSMLFTDYGQSAIGSGAPAVLKYLRQALAMGYFPGFAGEYWKDAASYERDRPLFKKYLPVIKTMWVAGWQPVTGARSSVSTVTLERFGPSAGHTYISAQNASTTTASTPTITAEAARLGKVTAAREMLSGASVPVSGGAFSAALAPGETKVFDVTVSGVPPSPTMPIPPKATHTAMPSSPGPTPTPTPPPVAVAPPHRDED